MAEPYDMLPPEKSLTVPRTYTMRPRPSRRAGATLKRISGSLLRALLWLLHGYRLVSLVVVAVYVAMIFSLSPQNSTPTSSAVLLQLFS